MQLSRSPVVPVRFGNITAIVLAGGKSTRLEGVDKSMLPLNGEPMIQHIVTQLENHFKEIIIGGEKKYSFLGHKVVPDEVTGSGPLMGVYSCLARLVTELNFITVCDIPENMNRSMPSIGVQYCRQQERCLEKAG